MSTLLVVGFPTCEEAEQVRRELAAIQREQLISLDDAVVVEHDSNGRVHLHQAVNLTGAGVGAASGALSDLGIDDGFLREVGDTLPQGSAALCVLAREAAPDRVIERLRTHAPHARLLRTNLSHADEAELRRLLEKASRQAEGLGQA
ncbi:MAG: DUF1269 domain-containing protein [Cyanobacteriota bacterium]|jgi:uncharacterized membrane protein